MFMFQVSSSKLLWAGNDNKEDGTQPNEADSEDDIPSAGFASFLKSFSGHGGTKSVNGEFAGPSAASARPKAVPRAKTAAAKAKAAAANVSKSKEASGSEQKVAIGKAMGAKRSRGANAVQSDPFADETTLSPQSKKQRGEKGEDLSEADQATLDNFNEKIKPLKILNPPVSDGPFKSHLTEHMSKITQVISELRVKKKSADRRTGAKTKSNQADMEFIQRLTDLENEVKEIHQLIRCA
jgi:hypothetical protein